MNESNKIETDLHIQRRVEREKKGGTNQGQGIKRYKSLCIKQISNQDTLYSTEKYSHYFIITLNGVESIEISNHYFVHSKVIYYKSTTLQ